MNELVMEDGYIQISMGMAEHGYDGAVSLE
jgi:hypothetical protein